MKHVDYLWIGFVKFFLNYYVIVESAVDVQR